MILSLKVYILITVRRDFFLVLTQFKGNLGRLTVNLHIYFSMSSHLTQIMFSIYTRTRHIVAIKGNSAYSGKHCWLH